jgi:hypothetical protein
VAKPSEVHWFDPGYRGPYSQAEEAIEHQALFLRVARQIIDSQAIGTGALLK